MDFVAGSSRGLLQQSICATRSVLLIDRPIDATLRITIDRSNDSCHDRHVQKSRSVGVIRAQHVGLNSSAKERIEIHLPLINSLW